MAGRLPDFLLLGAPKCGTSALHAALARHPGLYLSEPKEPKFFLTDGPPPRTGGGPGDVATWGEHVWRRTDYEALFAAAPPGARCGESTVFYLYDLAAQLRIRELLPAARLIAVLRDPVERAHSNWAHLRGPGWNRNPTRGGTGREPARVAAGWAHFWHYTDRFATAGSSSTVRTVPADMLLLRLTGVAHEPVARRPGVLFLGVSAGVLTGVPRRHGARTWSGAAPARPRRSGRGAPLFATTCRRAKWKGWNLYDWASPELPIRICSRRPSHRVGSRERRCRPPATPELRVRSGVRAGRIREVASPQSWRPHPPRPTACGALDALRDSSCAPRRASCCRPRRLMSSRAPRLLEQLPS